jgi:N utilization substance protein B
MVREADKGTGQAAGAGPEGKVPGAPERPASLATMRSVARLAAVQGLYQMDMVGTDLNEVIREFMLYRFGEQARFDFADADTSFFEDLIKGVVRRQRDIDPLLDGQLAAGWRLKRIDSILRAILRAGAFELIERADVPAGVVINEYIDVAHAFFGGDEPKVVNGVLDQIARKLRPGELPERG